MKKYIAILMTIILLFQAVPFSSLAEGKLTESELAAARALAGIGTEAAGFRSGATSSVENMNARELKEHLDSILDIQIHSLENYYEDIENKLERMKTEEPASYSMFSSGRYAGMPDKVHSRFRETEGVRMKLEYWSSHLNTCAGSIENNLSLLDEGSGTDYETRLRNHRIRRATEEIRSIRSEVSDQLDGCVELLENRIQEIADPGSSSGGFMSGASLGSWAAELLNESKPVMEESFFSSSSLFPQKQTLLARLSPVAVAQADEGDSLLRVLDDHHNLVEVRDEKNLAIKGAKVTVTDIREDDNPKTVTGETDAGGQFIFENAGFIMKDDRIAFSLEINADGYQIAWIDEVDLKKGGAFHISLISLPKDNASPYVAGCSFDGHDCLYSDYNVLYSPDNDYVNPITVMVVNPSDHDCIVHLMYQDADKKQYYHTMGAEQSDGKEDSSAVTVPAGGRVELVTRREWRRKLKSGGKQFEWTVDGETVTGIINEVLQIAIQDSGQAAAGFVKGSPELTSGHYSVTSTLLTVEAAKLEKPIVNVAMTGNFFASGMNILNWNFAIDSKLGPWFSSGQGGFDLPLLTKLIPRINVAIDGTVSVILGTEASVLAGKDGPLLSYKNKDSKAIAESLTEQDKKNRSMKKIKSAYNAGLLSTSGGLLLGNAKGTVGVFIGLVFREDKEQSPEDGSATWTSRSLSGVFGIVPCLNLDLTYQGTVGPVPCFIGANIDASAAIVGMLGGKVAVNNLTDLANEGYTGVSLDPKFSGLSVLINLTLTLSVGIGVKNFIEASINGYGYISILLEVKGNRFTHLKIWAAGGAYVKVLLAFAHYKQTIYDSPEWVITERSWSGGKAMPAQRAFSGIFLSSAQAEEGDDDEPLPPTETAKSLKATDYPALTAESQKVADSIGQKKGSAMKLLEIEGQMYAFYLQAEAGENKRTRVAWLNLATGHSGTFANALERAKEKKSLISDPDGKIGEYAWTNIISPAESILREINAVLYDQDDVAFDVAPVQIYGTATADIVRLYYKSLHVLAVFNADTAGTDDSNLSVKGTPSLYTLAFKRDHISGDLTADLEGLRQDRLPDPGITWNMLYSVGAAGTEEQLKDFAMSGVSVGGHLNILENREGHYWGWGANDITFGSNLASSSCILPVLDGEGGIDPSYQCFAKNNADHKGYLRLGTVPFQYEQKTYYSLEDAGDSDGTRQTLTYHSPYPDAVIEKDAAIPHFQTLNKAEMDYLFYVTAEDVSGNMLYHLKAANLEHKASVYDLPTYVFTDLDVTIPGARFRTQEIKGTIYVYWLESLADEKDRSRIVYRLRGVVYDPYTGIASDDIILAQFYPADNAAMEDMILTDLGLGYYVMDNNIYSFPFRLKASLDLDDVTLVDDVVGEGENDMVHIRLVNNGNMSISAFSLAETAVEMVMDEQTGKLSPTGDETHVLSVDCNTLDVSQNRVHLDGDDEDLDITGKEAVWREPLAVDGVTQDYWEVRQVVRTFTREGEYPNYDITYSDSDVTEVDIDAMEIMPGQVAAFSLMIKVPSGWTGQTHRLKLALQSFSASTSVTGSMAMQSGLMPETGALQANGTVTYRRSADGTMKRSNAGVQSGVSSLLADEAGVPMDAILDHQLDNLVLRGRVYRHAGGEKRVSLTISNDAVDHESIRLYCEVRYDGQDSPVYMDLPYDPDSTAHARTHTIDLPLSAIDNGRNAEKAEITIHGIGIEETTLLDNRYEVILRDSDPLKIVVQPQSCSALETETVKMSVKAAGGKPPYSYQWQEYMGESLGWRDIKDAVTDTLTLEKVTLGMNGRRYRCVVTDQNLDDVTSDEAVLTVRKRLLPTGDDGRLPLLLLAAAALLVCWFLIRRKQEKPLS